MRRLEALTPLSMAEIQADKDQLRAEFAMSTRRLEMSVEQMKAKTTSQLAEIGKKSEAIGRLKLELGEKTAAMFALEASEKQLARTCAHRGRIDGQDRRAGGGRARAGGDAGRARKLTANFDERSITADSQRVELVALRAQVEVLKGQIESYEQETKELHEPPRPARPPRRNACGQQLTEERNKVETARQPRRRARASAGRADHGSRRFSAAACRS